MTTKGGLGLRRLQKKSMALDFELLAGLGDGDNNGHPRETE